MKNTVDFSGKPFHFIGIGGIGMSALAYVLAKRNLPVSGSDQRPNNITKGLGIYRSSMFLIDKKQEIWNSFIQMLKSMIKH